MSVGHSKRYGGNGHIVNYKNSMIIVGEMCRIMYTDDIEHKGGWKQHEVVNF